MNQQDLYQKQLELEEHMSSSGLERLKRKNQREIDGGHGHRTTSGKMLMDAILEPATKALTEWIEKESVAKRRRHQSLAFLSLLDPELSIFIGSRILVDSVMSQARLVRACDRIGSQIEDEVKYSHFIQHGKLKDGGDVKPYWDQIMKKVERTRMRDYKAISQHLDNALDLHDLEWDSWSNRDRMRVGEKIVDIISESTDLVQVVTKVSGRKSKITIEPGAGILSVIEDYDARMGLLQPVWLPCVIKPKPWTKPFGGGYHGTRIKRLVLVKTRNRSYLDDLSGVDMPAVYEAINRLQDTPWSVNTAVLEVVQDLRASGFGRAGMPVLQNLEIPPFPDKTRPDFEEAKTAWKAEARQIHEYNALIISKRLATERIVKVAEDYTKYDEFFYAYQLDFRGRVYPVSSDLQPQGCDLSRGLIQFGEGKAINTPEHASWLAIHLANCFGVDKVSMVERVQWVKENTDSILSVATDPLSDSFWEDADKPFQFLAACFDWAGLMSDGYGYVSHLPIQMDGTCNGLQIFSLLLRDEVGGEGVNLVPKEEPQDIYQRVADQVIAKARKVLKTSPASDEGEWAERWLQLGIDRKLCKRPVMTLPYGVTKFSVRSFVHDTVKGQHGDQARETLFGDEKQTRQACNWMGDLVWEAIGDVVVAARGAMDWLQSLARAANATGRPVVWWTPSGFPVRQHYMKQRSRRLKLRIGETWLNAHITESTSKLDTQRQANGIAPNFVHSLDGAALALTVCKAAKQGVNSFSMVHDSYGTHAADAMALAECLRETFVDMFDGKDLLETLENDVRASCPQDALDVPERPGFGALVVQDVLDSVYFFA